MSGTTGTASGGLGRALAIAVVALAADQASKAAIRATIEPGERIGLLLGIDLVRVQNEGIAFGLFNEHGPLVIAITALAFAVLLTWVLLTARQPELALPIGLLAGGALGNLVDRVRLGGVTDFIDLPRWPAFNLADVWITAGVVILLLLWLVDRDGEREEPSPGGEESEPAPPRSP